MANLRANRITSTEVFETTGSVQFVRVPTSRLTTDLGSGLGDNFTIEFWILASGIASGSSSPGMFQLSDTSGGLKASTESLALAWSTSNNYSIFYAGSLGTGSITNDPNTNDVWKHYAMVRSNGILKIYVDGIEKTSANVTDDFSGYRYLAIGTYYSTSYPWQGHISNFRILKGTALYTENFTPPTRELEVIPNTVLLACQHKTDASHEKTGQTITVNGDAVANELTPGLLTSVVKSGGSSAITGSVEFDGTGDYLLLNSGSSDFTLGTGDFTIECWAYPTRYGGIFQFFDSSVLDQTTSGPSIGIDVSENEWKIRYGTNSTGDSNIDVEYNQWYHLAYVRNSSTTTLYLNGINIFSVSDSTNYSANYPVVGGWYDTDYLMKGFISNFRVIKGTALYTSDFIPPTRNLTNLPGTVLLCCQDSNDPTTEATGKTITGYGDLSRTDIGINLVTNGDFSNNTDGWSVLNTGTFTASGGQATLSDSDGTGTSPVAYQSISTFIPGAMYVFQFDTTAAREAYAYVSTTAGSNTLGMSSTYATPAYTGSLTGTRKILFRATQSTMIINFNDGSGSDFDITIDNVSVYKLDPGNRASDFTPSVGSDDSVEFAGPTTINTENYFYLPTGSTEQRAPVGNYNAGTRGIFGGGFSSPSTHHDTIQFITIASTGDATDFGTLTQSRYGNAALSDSTRAIWAGGVNPTPSYFNTIDYVTIMSGGAAQDFGDLYSNVYYPAGVSNATRGVWSGGYQVPSPAGFRNEIGYVTIASKGDSQDFGDLTTARNSHSSFSSPTRGVFAGGATPTKINSIEYITISSTGNAQDFGDLTVARNYAGGCSNAIRGLIGGGSNPSADNTIDYVTIQSTGNATDFGDITAARQEIGSCSSATRGVFAGAWSPSKVNTIDYVQIMTTGNAQTFGELVNIGVMQEMGTSNGHGGLG